MKQDESWKCNNREKCSCISFIISKLSPGRKSSVLEAIYSQCDLIMSSGFFLRLGDEWVIDFILGVVFLLVVLVVVDVTVITLIFSIRDINWKNAKS